MPGKLPVLHHTLSDWDFQHGSLYRSLAADQYISAPTSLKFTAPGESWVTMFLCRLPATQCLPQGEVRNWVRRHVPVYHPAVFRNQAPLGSANPLNQYAVELSFSVARLIRYDDGVYNGRDSTPCYTAADEWIHYRFFWYNGKTPGLVPALCVDVYREVTGEWLKEGSTMYDEDNKWKDSEINRCGCRPISQRLYAVYFDDTEIWGPV